MAGEWKNYRGKWHGSYYMIDGRMYAHVTQYGTSVPEIVVRLPNNRGFAHWHPRMLPRDIEAARALALKRVAALHPEQFSQREMEV